MGQVIYDLTPRILDGGAPNSMSDIQTQPKAAKKITVGERLGAFDIVIDVLEIDAKNDDDYDLVDYLKAKRAEIQTANGL